MHDASCCIRTMLYLERYVDEVNFLSKPMPCQAVDQTLPRAGGSSVEHHHAWYQISLDTHNPAT